MALARDGVALAVLRLEILSNMDGIDVDRLRRVAEYVEQAEDLKAFIARRLERIRRLE